MLADRHELFRKRLDAGEDAGGRRLVFGPLFAVPSGQHSTLATGDDPCVVEHRYTLKVVLSQCRFDGIPKDTERIHPVGHRLTLLVLSDHVGPRIVARHQMAAVTDGDEHVGVAAHAEQDGIGHRFRHDLEVPRGAVAAGQHRGTVANRHQ